MSRSVSPISDKSYGLAAVCRAWRLARSGVYRHRTPAPVTSPKRRGSVGPMPDASLLAAIRAVLAASPFTAKAIARCGLGYAMMTSGRRCAGCCG